VRCVNQLAKFGDFSENRHAPSWPAEATNGLLEQRPPRLINFERRRVRGGSAEFTSADGGGVR